MSSFDSNDPSDEALWRVLGKARRVEASPYFARKVSRELRVDADRQPGWWQLFLRTIAPSAACASLAVVAISAIYGDRPLVANADIEFETIQNLDLMVSNYESSIWLDPASSSH